MFIVEQYALAVALCIVTMLCWGSWANTQKLAGKTWRFELFYWDYVLGVLLAALIFAFTLGSSGAAGRPFLEDLRQASGGALGSASVGGIVFNAANILLVAAMAPDFKAMEPGKIGPYTAMVLFSAGLVASNVVFNTILMRKPVSGERLEPAAYFTGTARDHFWGVAGGMIWALGMTLSIIAFGVAGPAISYGLGQGATMVAAAWGVFVWREFAAAPPGTARLLALMFVCFIAGLALIIAAGA